MSKTVLFHIIQFKISIVFVYTQLNVKTVFFQMIQFSVTTVSMSKTVLFQTIQFTIKKLFHFKQFHFSISTQFSIIWLVDRTLSDVTSPCQREPGSNGNEEKLCIPESFSITRTSPSNCLVLYPGHSFAWGGGALTPPSRSNRYILPPQPTGQAGFYYSSSSSRAASTDILDHLSPLFPIVHRFRQVFWVTSCVLT